jgi:hypothetical protein
MSEKFEGNLKFSHRIEDQLSARRSAIRKPDREGRSFIDPGVDDDAALVQVNDLGGQRKPDAVAIRVFFIFAAIEGGKNMCKIIGCDPDAVIGETEDRRVFFKTDADGALMVAGEFTAVLDDIAEGHLQ